MFDLLSLVPEKRIACLDKGFAEIIDVMPRLISDEAEYRTADSAVVQAARVSYGHGTKKRSHDRDLIRYMIRHDHGSPLETVAFKFVIKMPIFVARQLIRHRLSSVSEVSARYTEMPGEFYETEILRAQSKTNKQGSSEESGFVTYAAKANGHYRESYTVYEAMIEAGVAKEQARNVLPVALYTRWQWCLNLRSLLNVLDLRCDPHAQEECRLFANAILELVRPLIPMTIEAWEDYSPYRGAVLLTRLEADALRKLMAQMDSPCTPSIASENKREQAEWAEKAKKMGLS